MSHELVSGRAGIRTCLPEATVLLSLPQFLFTGEEAEAGSETQAGHWISVHGSTIGGWQIIKLLQMQNANEDLDSSVQAVVGHEDIGKTMTRNCPTNMS